MNRRFSLLVLAAAALALVPAQAGAVSGADAIGYLNAQRAANGLPAGIVERADWSQACAQHNHYERLNDDLTHDEDPARSGYTDAGAWAGQNAVLSAGDSWADGNPFQTAPLHLAQILAPRLAEMGVDEQDEWVCATTWPGMTRPHPPGAVLYSLPGDGVTGVTPSEIAAEWPFVPGDFVGLPEGTRTGPHLYVLADAPEEWLTVQITAASLTGPDGPLEVRWVDNTTPTVGSYIPPGGIVIPTRPLRARGVYAASVTATVAGVAVTRTWNFTTGGGATDCGAAQHTNDAAWAALRRLERSQQREYRRLMRWHRRLSHSSARSVRAYRRALAAYNRRSRTVNSRAARARAAQRRASEACH
jgi:hypothetical protein